MNKFLLILILMTPPCWADEVDDARREIISFCVHQHDIPLEPTDSWLTQAYKNWKARSAVSKCIDAQVDALNKIDWASDEAAMCTAMVISPDGFLDNVRVQECIEEIMPQ